MNPLKLESAFQTALQAAFPGVTIYRGSDYQELTPESLNLIVSVASLDQQAPGAYIASVMVKVASPALLGADSLTEFSATIDAVRAAMDQATLFTNWPAQGGPSLAGIWHEGVSDSTDAHLWVAELKFKAGVVD